MGPLGYGVANALSKITGGAVGVDRGVILQTFFAAAFTILIGSWFVRFGEFDLYWIFIAFIIGLAGYFPLLFFIKAITRGKAGVIVPIIDLATVVALLCTYIFFGQSVSLLGLVFVAVILFGVILLTVNIRDFKNSSLLDLNSGVLFAIIAATLWGASYFLWSLPTAHLGPVTTSIILELGTCTAALISLLIIKREKLFGTIPKNILLVGILIGFCGFLGTFGVNLGITKIGAPLTFAILGARPAVSALVGYFYFKEKLSQKQFLALILIVVGVVGVSLFK